MNGTSQPIPLIRLTYAMADGIKTFESGKGEILIGRGQVDFDLSFDVNVSRRHARIFLKDGNYFLEDLGSKWGTSWNGRRLKDGEVRKLAAGDAFSPGNLQITIEHLGSDEKPVLISETVDAGTLKALAVSSDGFDLMNRLSLLYEIPLKLASVPKLDDALPVLVRELMKIIPMATRCALVVKDRAGEDLILKAWLPEAEPGFSTTLAARAMASREGFIWQNGQGDTSASIREQNIGTGMYAPLVWRDLVCGVICVDNSLRHEVFEPDDLKLLVAVANYAAMTVANYYAQEDLERHATLMKRMISCRFSPDVRAKLMHDAVTGLLPMGTRKSHLCVLVSDIRGFTQLTSQIGAQSMGDLLNDFFPSLIDAIHAHKGTVERFAGDAIFAVFGSPEPDAQQHEHAVRAALAMREAAANIMRTRAAKQLDVCEIGIGIDCGEALHGFIGNAQRLEYAVIGSPANHAARYSSAAAKGEVLISPEVYGRVFNKFKCEKTQIETKHEGIFPAFRIKGAS